MASIRLCAACEQEIPSARLRAQPSATLCVACLEKQGDVARVSGYMSWEHKTAPELVLGKDAEVLRKYHRHGVYAELPFTRRPTEE